MSTKVSLPPAEDRRLRALARLKAIRVENETLWQTHPYPFIRDAVWTIDQQKGSDGGGPRRHPAASTKDPAPECPCSPSGCENYYHHLVNVWFVESSLLLPKSRRLMASWTVIACYYWLARYRPNQMIAFASRKQGQHDSEGSAELVKRAWQIHQHLPGEAQKRDVTYSWCRLRFDNGSEIVGIAQGADQARQYTFTGYLADEFAFWEWAGKTYNALLPTLEGGGRFTGISTASPGFMEQLVLDRWAGTGGDDG